MNLQFRIALLILAGCLVTVQLTAASTPAQDSATIAKCPRATEINAIFSELQILKDQKPLLPNEVLPCALNSTEASVLRALIFLKQYAELPHLDVALDKNILGEDAWRFFKDRVKVISFVSEDQTCHLEFDNGPNQAAVAAYYKDQTIYVCPKVIGSEFFIAQLLVHEARHAQGLFHIDCTRGPLKGHPLACEARYDLGGPYAAEVEYVLRLSQHPKIDGSERRNLLNIATTGLYQRFNLPPLPVRPALLLKDKDGLLSTFDGGALLPLAKVSANSILVERAGTNVIYDPETRKAQTVSALGPIPPDGLMANEYEKGVSAKLQRELVDVLYGDDYSCMLFLRELWCFPNRDLENSYVRIPLQILVPAGFLFSHFSTLVTNRMPYLVDHVGDVYTLPKAYSDLLISREEDFKLVGNFKGYRKALKAPWNLSLEFALLRSGEIKLLDGEGNLLPVSELKGQRFDGIAPILLVPEQIKPLLQK